MSDVRSITAEIVAGLTQAKREAQPQASRPLPDQPVRPPEAKPRHLTPEQLAAAYRAAGLRNPREGKPNG